MPDHIEQLARNLQIYYPISAPHIRHEIDGDREFSFFGSSNTTSSENDCDQLGSSEAIGFNKEAKFFADPSRSEAIEQGRRELMEMVQDMPDESSYELSFQHMVIDEKHVQLPDQIETSLDNTHMHSNSSDSNKIQIKKQNKKSKSNSSNRPNQILRVESMDSQTFLLKMFFPTSLKKVKVKKGSHKVSPKSCCWGCLK